MQIAPVWLLIEPDLVMTPIQNPLISSPYVFPFMSNFSLDENAPILVEPTPKSGLQQVSLSPTEIAQKSKEAVNSAMNTIYQMAQRVVVTVDALANKPSEVEVEFSLKLNAELGQAFIAKAQGESTMKVKLSWKRQESSNEQQ